ncbi:transposase [Burkholderia humptydooensis]|nr:transposase [Burkholderia humptydooensis]
MASRREGLSVMSTVTNRGQVRWKVFEGAMNADILPDFLKRLIKDMRSKKVFLILDNLKVHHVKPVKAWLAEHVDEIEVFYLPSYSPKQIIRLVWMSGFYLYLKFHVLMLCKLLFLRLQRCVNFYQNG